MSRKMDVNPDFDGAAAFSLAMSDVSASKWLAPTDSSSNAAAAILRSFT
jgi:hypothetical protein